MTALDPPGAELAASNRRLIAERLGWPTGAVEACERVEAEAPGWQATWSDGTGMTLSEPGFYAGRVGWHVHDPGPRWMYGATADELLAAIEAAPPVQSGLREYRPLDLPAGD